MQILGFADRSGLSEVPAHRIIAVCLQAEFKD